MPHPITTPGYVHRGLDELFRMARATPLNPRCDSFYFVRHGETDGNYQRIFQTADQLLNARGLEQAERASTALASAPLARIISSTMHRAWRTAEIVAAPHGLSPEPEDGLRERWFGDMVGTSSADHDWRHDPPNGETLLEFVMRTQAGIARSLASTVVAPAGLSATEQPRTKTLLVGHGGILYVLAPSLGLELSTALLANAAPLLFAKLNDRWTVKRLADTGGRGDNIE